MTGMSRRHITYVSWTEHHPDQDYAHPHGFLVVLAVDHDTAREAVTDLVGAYGWEFWGRVAPDPKSCPLGMLAILAVADTGSQLWVDDGHGGLEPRPMPQPVGGAS